MSHWKVTFDAHISEDRLVNISNWIVDELTKKLGVGPGQVCWNIGFENLDAFDAVETESRMKEERVRALQAARDREADARVTARMPLTAKPAKFSTPGFVHPDGVCKQSVYVDENGNKFINMRKDLAVSERGVAVPVSARRRR
jgi:hypothetical protein